MGAKKILIFSAAFGEGHNAAARGLRDGLLQFANGEVDVRIVDLFEVYGRVYSIARRAYLAMIHQAPWLWEKIYKRLDTGSLQTQLSGFGKMRSRLAKLLEEEKPDAVVSTYPIYGHLLRVIYSEGKQRPFSLTTIITDSLTVNSAWYRCASDCFIVANEDTARVLRAAEVPDEKIRVLGFPVNPWFAAHPIERKIPSAQTKCRVLYMIHSSSQTACELVRALLALPEISLTVTVGKNESLQKKIEMVISETDCTAEVYGWTDQLPKLLADSHLLISKAGGATVQEAIAARVPMIVNQVVPGQEAGNVQLLLDNECGALAETMEAIVETVRGAIADDAQLWQKWLRNLEKIRHPNAAVEIAKFIL